MTGRVVPTGGLPLDVGAVVCNASTLLNVADAAAGKKVVEKYGDRWRRGAHAAHVQGPVGISCRELLEAAGRVRPSRAAILSAARAWAAWWTTRMSR